MEKNILILKNIYREGPGLIKDVLTEHNLKYEIVEQNQLENILSVEKLGALIVLGGPASANDEDLIMKKELDLIKKVVKANIPYLGICLGLQTLVKAMGGEVLKCETKEIGFRNQNDKYYNIELTHQGRIDNLFYNLPDSLTVFQLHGETVQLSSGMFLLASGDPCKNQVVKVGSNAYGIQCHFELKEEMLDLWLNNDQDLQQLDKNQVKSDFKAICKDYQNTGRQLITNFLRISGFLD